MKKIKTTLEKIIILAQKLHIKSSGCDIVSFVKIQYFSWSEVAAHITEFPHNFFNFWNSFLFLRAPGQAGSNTAQQNALGITKGPEA